MTPQTTGRKIRALRRSQNLTQEQLGEKVGVTFQQIGKYEAGRDTLSVEKLIKIAAVFKVHPIELLPSDAFEDTQTTTHILGIPFKAKDLPLIIKILNILSNADMLTKAKIEAMIRGLGLDK